MYRPTVRYSDSYKRYINDTFKATTLDRNQIIRLALFIAAHSYHYQDILKAHKLPDVPLPRPEWSLSDEGLWKDPNYSIKPEPSPGGIKMIIG